VDYVDMSPSENVIYGSVSITDAAGKCLLSKEHSWWVEANLS
jgi:hypothetical protein